MSATPIAFYAPLKSPHHPRPSGDRTVGRLLVAALTRAGYEVELASAFRSRDGAGDEHRQRRLAALGEHIARRWLRRVAARPAACRPRLWFTYHLYHKAPDWLGPRCAAALGIPYVVAEASSAPKRADGPWRAGHRAVAGALASAAAVFSPNAADDACVLPLLADPGRLHRLAPFLDLAALPVAAPREAARGALAERYGLAADRPWIGCVAMMRDGDKLASYRLLAESLARLRGHRWQLLVAGDGDARPAVEATLAALPGADVRLLGRLGPEEVATLWSAADVCAWPAVGEAYGMALLEAQAAGVPVVAGRSGGVPGVVADGEGGLLVDGGDADAFAAALGRLLAEPRTRRRMGTAAARRVRERHDIDAAAARLRQVLGALPGGAP